MRFEVKLIRDDGGVCASHLLPVNQFMSLPFKVSLGDMLLIEGGTLAISGYQILPRLHDVRGMPQVDQPQADQPHTAPAV